MTALAIACAVLAVLTVAGWAAARRARAQVRQLRLAAAEAALAEAALRDQLGEAERALEAGRAVAELDIALAYKRGTERTVPRETSAGGTD